MNVPKEHGSTALGWMTLQGSKSEGTDMHSRTAKEAGVSRDEAKILNYGRIYGAGVSFASQLLQKFNSKLTEQDANSRAAGMYRFTKGERLFQLNKMGKFIRQLCFGEDSETVTKRELNQIKAKLDLCQKVFHDDANIDNLRVRDDFLPFFLCSEDGTISKEEFLRFQKETKQRSSYQDILLIDDSEVCTGGIWVGGTESYAFNKLEEIALSQWARTPVLGCRISNALAGVVVGDRFLPSRINWVVQSSAVDYLHLLLSSMQWLFEKHQIKGRFAISIHDEVRYLVEEKDAFKAAWALQVSNLLVRAIFCKHLEMNSLPMDVAFFSGVDIDQVMRKEPNADCVTPTNPQGLKYGYGIENGLSLNMQDLVTKYLK